LNSRLNQERELEEFHDRLATQVRMEREDIFFDGLGKGDPGDLERRFDPFLFFGRYLLFKQIIQEGEVAEPLCQRCLKKIISECEDGKKKSSVV